MTLCPLDCVDYRRQGRMCSRLVLTRIREQTATDSRPTLVGRRDPAGRRPRVCSLVVSEFASPPPPPRPPRRAVPFISKEVMRPVLQCVTLLRNVVSGACRQNAPGRHAKFRFSRSRRIVVPCGSPVSVTGMSCRIRCIVCPLSASRMPVCASNSPSAVHSFALCCRHARAWAA